MAVTPIERLKGKFLQARGVAQRVASNMEAEADSLIAQEDAMKVKTASAFAPHKAILAEAGSELKAIEDALNLMSNGGPALDPLPDADTIAPNSATQVSSIISFVSEPTDDTGEVHRIKLNSVQNG